MVKNMLPAWPGNSKVDCLQNEEMDRFVHAGANSGKLKSTSINFG